MLLEGTSLYFWLIFLIIILILITKKISLMSIYKKARINQVSALIPFKCRIDLVFALHLNRSVAYMSYIPIYGLKFRKMILQTLLGGFGLNQKDYIYFLLFPMYKYPELAFRNVKLIQNDYSLTETFLESEKLLSGEEVKEVKEPSNPTNDLNYNQNMTNEIFKDNKPKIDPKTQKDNIEHYINQDIFNQEQSVFVNQNLTPDERKETYVEAKRQEVKKQTPIITPLNKDGEKTCPKCGAKLASNAKTCFLCGTSLN